MSSSDVTTVDISDRSPPRSSVRLHIERCICTDCNVEGIVWVSEWVNELVSEWVSEYVTPTEGHLLKTCETYYNSLSTDITLVFVHDRWVPLSERSVPPGRCCTGLPCRSSRASRLDRNSPVCSGRRGTRRDSSRGIYLKRKSRKWILGFVLWQRDAELIDLSVVYIVVTPCTSSPLRFVISLITIK